MIITSASDATWKDFKHSHCLWGYCQYIHWFSWKSTTPLPSPRGGLLCENLHLPLACCFFHRSEGLQPFPAPDLQLGTDSLLPWWVSATLPAQQIICPGPPPIQRYRKLSCCLLPGSVSSKGFPWGPGSLMS